MIAGSIAIYWLIKLSLSNGPLYFKRSGEGYVMTPSKEESTQYPIYKDAQDARFKFLGKGQNFEIKPHRESK